MANQLVKWRVRTLAAMVDNGTWFWDIAPVFAPDSQPLLSWAPASLAATGIVVTMKRQRQFDKRVKRRAGYRE